jgi:hypothetical protein
MSRRPALLTEADIKCARKAAPGCLVEFVTPDGTTIRFFPDDWRPETGPELAGKKDFKL